MLRIGLIGCGGIGTVHNKALKAISQDLDIEVVALADRREDFLKRAKALWPNAKTYELGLDLIDNEEIDAVHICLPSFLHTDHAIRAMEKGLDVMIEKPVCLTEEDCERLLNVREQTGSKVMVGQVLRFFDEYRYLKKIFDSKEYGELQTIELGRKGGDVQWGYEDWFHDDKKSGSVMLDLHIHDVDFLHYLLGKPDSLQVNAEKRPSGLVHHVTTAYRFGKVSAVAEALWDISPSLPFEAYFKASFEQGILSYSSKRDPSLSFIDKNGERPIKIFKPEETEKTVEMEKINIKDIGPYYDEIRYFVKCLLDDKPIGQATLEDGIEAVRIVLMEQGDLKR